MKPKDVKATDKGVTPNKMQRRPNMDKPSKPVPVKKPKTK